MELDVLIQRLQDHMASDERAFNDIKEILNNIQDSQDRVQNNHLAHIEPDMAALKSDMEWVKKIVTGALFAGIGAFITALFQLIRH